MRRLALLALLLASTEASATWSVIALDRDSGRMVIASATCVAQGRFASFPAEGLMDVQAVVVPGMGIAAAQAGVDVTRANQSLIRERLAEGVAPEAILAELASDPALERRQFGILDMKGRRGGFSGAENGTASLDVQGEVPGTSVVYSIQGNILASDAVVERAVEAFREADGTLEDRVMAAMEAADQEGGDRRCTCESEPLPDAPCDGKTSHVAYLLSVDADTPEGEHELYIDVTDENIQPSENANPVRTLRMRYDALSP